jgi:polar amino acid transport system permease protein
VPPSSTSSRQEARAAARRARARRGAGISALSTVLVVGVLVTLIVTAKGWHDVKATFFDPDAFSDAFPDVLSGFWLDVKLFCVVEVAVLVLGLLVALGRVQRVPALYPLRLGATVYVDLFRGVPTLLLVYLVGFGLPALDLSGVPTDPVLLGGFALALSYSAYVSEVYRAGIESVHPSQRAAARSLGLTNRQALRYVVLPQAVRRQVPPLLNDLVSLQKDTGLVSIGGAIDAVRAADIIVGRSLNYTPYIVAGLVFVALTIPMTRFTDWVTARMDRQRAQGGTV